MIDGHHRHIKTMFEITWHEITYPLETGPTGLERVRRPKRLSNCLFRLNRFLFSRDKELAKDGYAGFAHIYRLVALM